MAEALSVSYWDDSSEKAKAEWRSTAEILLSIVKKHIGDVSKVCPECGGSGKIYDVRYLENPEICTDCKGSGVIARKDEV